MQRMLPPDAPRPEPSTSQNSLRPITDTLHDGRAAPNTQPVPADTRAFEYRFSKKYLSSLPEGQRPLERDIFGERYCMNAACPRLRRCNASQGPFPLPTLMSWRATGAFGGPDCENIEIRVKGQTAGEWGSWQDVVMSRPAINR